MSLKETIIKLEKKGWVSRKPKPIFVFLLFFAYLLVWFVVFTLYIKFDMISLKLWIIFIGIFTFLTLIHAIIHNYVSKIIEQQNEIN